MTPRTALLTTCLVSLLAGSASGQEKEPKRDPLLTRWAADVTADRVLPEHPRPSLVRATWTSLNGEWEYAIRPREAGRPATFDGKILVPFPVESHLSGVERSVSAEQRLWYRTSFSVPGDWGMKRVLLHFGAVDWRADVWVDGHRVGNHEGGYDPFAIDVTDFLASAGEHELVVSAWDPTDAGFQPRGKQVREPRGIWYTPTTGIWQSVWLEGVPRSAVESVTVAEIEGSRVRIAPHVLGLRAGQRIEVQVSFQGTELARQASNGAPIDLKIGALRRWSPADPALYDLRVRILEGERVVDAVDSYFALRSIVCRPDAAGVPRFFLNGEALFQFGLLDQGFWPDGLYTAPTDAALRYDLEVTKALGFNLVRKHVKVEPERWYYHCDRLGLLVWQDIPSGGPYIGPADPDAVRAPQNAANFEREAARIVDAFGHHPCIVSWVLFNEGWGQYDTERLAAWLADFDPSRVVNATSGWSDRGVGQVHDLHAYPGPAVPRPGAPRVAVLGEFGGLGLPLSGHTWQKDENWGYRSFTSKQELNDAYLALVARLRPLISQGLAAAVYTQTTDVEIEVNGVMSYDREVLKLDDPRVVAANRLLYLPPPSVEELVATSQSVPQIWRYTLQPPADGWERRGFDDGSWRTGRGGFGTEGTPGAVVGTTWSSGEIWLRREVVIPDLPEDGTLALRIHHDERAQVYWNGALVADLDGYTSDYVFVPLTEADRAHFAAGSNTIAVRCRQTSGGQFLDLGLSVLRERR